jgi:hypothetical protein
MIEKEILVDDGKGSGMLLKYSLSNYLAEIRQAIKARTKTAFDLDDIAWVLNADLSESVKKLMNENDVDYSMTTYLVGSIRRTIINRRMGNKWFYYAITPVEYRQKETDKNLKNAAFIGVGGLLLGGLLKTLGNVGKGANYNPNAIDVNVHHYHKR